MLWLDMNLVWYDLKFCFVAIWNNLWSHIRWLFEMFACILLQRQSMLLL